LACTGSFSPERYGFSGLLGWNFLATTLVFSAFAMMLLSADSSRPLLVIDLASAEISLSLVESGQLNMCSVSHMHCWRDWYCRVNAAVFSKISRHPSEAV